MVVHAFKSTPLGMASIVSFKKGRIDEVWDPGHTAWYGDPGHIAWCGNPGHTVTRDGEFKSLHFHSSDKNSATACTRTVPVPSLDKEGGRI